MSTFADTFFGAVDSLGDAISDVGRSLFKNPDTPVYNAQWGHLNEHASAFNRGFTLRGGLAAITQEASTKNAIICGGTGAGKTSCILVGSILSLSRGNASMVVLDVEKEVFKLTSGYLANKKGYQIYCIDFGEKSDAFNPLHGVTSAAEIQNISHSLIKNGGVQSNDLYWSASAEAMLSTFLQYVVSYCPVEQRSIASTLRLLELFSYAPEQCDILFSKIDNVELLSQYKTIVATPEKTRLSSLSTLTTALKIFKNPAVRRCTSVSTFDFNRFRSEPSILYYCTPVMETNILAPISSLLFESVFKTILSRIPDPHRELCIYALIDELVSMRFQDLGVVYSQIRKFQGGCMGLIQDLEMLKMRYSPAECHAILSNSYSKVFLPGQNLTTCRQLEEILGLQTVVDSKSIERVRPLMPASEIRMTDRAIIIHGNYLPILARLKPFYRHPVLSSKCRIPAYTTTKKIPFDEPPLIQFDSL